MAEPEVFERGDRVESTSGFFEGVGEVLKTVNTRWGTFVHVAHQGGSGEVQSLCAPDNLKKVKE